MNTKPMLLSATVLALAAAANAQQIPQIPPELRARFGFDGPIITKLGDGLHSLDVADLDGDGKVEAVIADTRRARIVALRIRDGKAEIDPIPTAGQIAGYAFGDVDADGRDDLLFVDSRGRLQLTDSSTKKTKKLLDLGLGGRGIGMFAGDLDGDGKDDLVAVSRSGLRWATRLLDDPVLSRIEPTEEKAHSFDLLDLDNDGHLDLLYVVPAPTMNLRFRRGHGDGVFGPWSIISIESLRHAFGATLSDGTTGLATIEGPNRRVTLKRFSDNGDQAPPQWWTLPETRSNRSLPFAIGDIDGDGDDDLVLAQSERAQLLLFEWTGNTFSMRALPSLAGVNALALGDLDGDEKLDILLASPEENVLAWKPGSEPIDAFPTPIPCTDKPVAVAIHPDGGAVVLARTDRRQAHLDLAKPGEEPHRIVDIGRVPADPSRLLLADVGAAEGLEAAFVVPGEGLRVVTLEEDEKVAAKKKGAAGFTKKMNDGALSLCEHEGRQALMVVRDRFVRRFRIDASGRVSVLAQDNGPDGIDTLSLSTDLPNGCRIYLDKKNGKLLRVPADGTPESIDLPTIPFTHIAPHGDAVLLLGPRGVLRVPFGPGPTLTTIASHDPPTERTSYWHGLSADFDHDGTADLALMDGFLPGVQFLAGGPNSLRRALAMPVFEAPPSENPHNEPRDMAAGDLDGDGRTDLVLLAFDRILVYLQQE